MSGLAHPSICAYGIFLTSDEALILISIENEREWSAFCAKLLDAAAFATLQEI